jgi:cysteine-rich repeat protein
MSAAGSSLVGALIAVVLAGSCFYDTKTTLCGTSGLRCPPGWVCSLEQDACIEVGTCGDGLVSGSEACDDGNRVDGDGCSADCLSDESCGNGVLDMIAGESCDDGNVLSGDNCSPDCQLAACSNRIVDVNEDCDSGGVDTKGCNADCSFVTCGDKRVNSAAGEECDDGMDPSATCNSPLICTMPKCGDGIYNGMAGEECDTGGDTRACNGADASNGLVDSFCKIPRCGDNYTNKKFPLFPFGPTEECDKGGVDMPGCDSDCTAPVCGDSHANAAAGEECDDGNTLNDDTCVSIGTLCKKAVCGDGYRRTVVGPMGEPIEECDHGTSNNNADPDTCRTDCRQAFCGDGVIDSGEECDGGTAYGGPPAETCPSPKICRPRGDPKQCECHL